MDLQVDTPTTMMIFCHLGRFNGSVVGLSAMPHWARYLALRAKRHVRKRREEGEWKRGNAPRGSAVGVGMKTTAPCVSLTVPMTASACGAFWMEPWSRSAASSTWDA